MKDKRNKGITLIALVVTIIVLLILAGISIAMLSGNNGILQRAGEAKTGTIVEQEKETIALAYNSALVKKAGNGNISAVTDSELNNELDNSEATADGNPIIVTFTKTGNAYEIDSQGVIKPSTLKDPNASNLTATELAAIESNNIANPTDQIEEITSSITNTNLKDTTKIKAVLTGDVPIPVGANYLTGTVDTGVVIDYKGSEFVWIPVPVTEGNLLYPKGTTKSMAIPIDYDSPIFYQTILYEYGETYIGQSGARFTAYDSSYESYKFKEPYIIDDYDNDTQVYLSGIGLTQSEFQTEINENYNKMIESVLKYGGFFVGRYETGLNGNIVSSINNDTSMSAESDNNQMWYGMYDKQKKFTTNTDTMQSSMIWGSQYDAMLNWMQEGTQSVGFTDVIDFTKYTQSGVTINNICELGGSLMEWTLTVNEKLTNNSWDKIRLRTYKDGLITSNGSVNIDGYFSSYGYSPDGVNPMLGSRMSLYIK